MTNKLFALAVLMLIGILAACGATDKQQPPSAADFRQHYEAALDFPVTVPDGLLQKGAHDGPRIDAAALTFQPVATSEVAVASVDYALLAWDDKRQAITPQLVDAKTTADVAEWQAVWSTDAPSYALTDAADAPHYAHVAVIVLSYTTTDGERIDNEAAQAFIEAAAGQPLPDLPMEE